MKVSIIILTLFIAIQKSSADTPINFLRESPIENENCPAYDNPEHPKHLPHPDCGKFYKCANGLAYPMDCPKGQHWSVQLDRCDWPSVAQCDPNIETTAKPEPPTTDPSDPITNVCESIDSGSLLPHPTDCTKYIQCDNGRTHIRQCPAGLHFSVDYNQCQFPDIANCQVKNEM